MHHPVSKYCKRSIENAKNTFYAETVRNTLVTSPDKFWRLVTPRECNTGVILWKAHGKRVSDAEGADPLDRFFAIVQTIEVFPVQPVPSPVITANVYCQ